MSVLLLTTYHKGAADIHCHYGWDPEKYQNNNFDGPKIPKNQVHSSTLGLFIAFSQVQLKYRPKKTCFQVDFQVHFKIQVY